MKKLTKALKTLAKGHVKSIRQLAYYCAWPYESTRRWIKSLSSEEAKRSFARWVLRRWCGSEDYVLVALDPTYLRAYEEGLLVASLVITKGPGKGRAVPLYWEGFNWKEMEEENQGMYSRNLFQKRFVQKLKQLVYPRKLVIIADREFGRKSFLEFLKKKGIYWVIRHPKHSWPPNQGEGLVVKNPKEPSEPYLLSFRLPSDDLEPVSLYLRRMSIEESFRDAKSSFGLRKLLRRVEDREVKEGLVFLIFASIALVRLVAEELGSDPTKPPPHIRESLYKLFQQGYYSLIYIGRLCLISLDEAGADLSSTAPSIYNELRSLCELKGGG